MWSICRVQRTLINTGWVPKDDNNAVYEVAFEFTNDFTYSRFFGYSNNYSQPTECLAYLTKVNNENDKLIYIYIYNGLDARHWNACFTNPGEVLHLKVGKGATYINDVKQSYKAYLTNTGNLFIYLFGANIKRSDGSFATDTGSVVRIPYFNATDDLTEIRMVPALDNTGTPCMFDLISRTPFRNDGTGDFVIGIETQQQLDNLLNSFPNYTGQAIENMQINLAEALQTPENEARLAEAMAQNSTMPAMLSLDGEFVAPKFYAQLTEHGIRRLYHVPKGYTGTMDEYAAENGFKELIEPPAPLEGYWTPVWRETETQLICDWVETEPPTESLEEP